MRQALPYDLVIMRWIAEASGQTLVPTSEEPDDEREALTADKPMHPILEEVKQNK